MTASPALSRFLIRCAAVLALCAAPPPALAAPAGNEAHMTALRVDLAGRQRLLSQRIAAAACFVTLGVDLEDQRRILGESADLFRLGLLTLEGRNAAYGVAAADNDETRAALAEERAVWDQTEPWIAAVLQGGGDRTPLAAIAQAEPRLLATAQSVVEAIVAEQGAATDPARAGFVNLVARQRMLGEKITKEACFVSAGMNPLVHTGALLAARQQFVESAARIGTETDKVPSLARGAFEVQASLARASDHWHSFSALLVEAEQGRPLDREDLYFLSGSFEMLLDALEETVWLAVKI